MKFCFWPLYIQAWKDTVFIWTHTLEHLAMFVWHLHIPIQHLGTLTSKEAYTLVERNWPEEIAITVKLAASRSWDPQCLLSVGSKLNSSQTHGLNVLDEVHEWQACSRSYLSEAVSALLGHMDVIERLPTLKVGLYSVVREAECQCHAGFHLIRGIGLTHYISVLYNI